jgi:hypothetical protein
MIKKEKIFELKIQDDDELSGIDSISLVDEPAIEVNWVAFKKEKEHEFHIPDGEDNIYIEKLLKFGQPEEELLNNGWVMQKENFLTSSPNSESVEDTSEYLIRYKYVKNPEAPGAAVKETTRDFCKVLLSKNFVYRVEDLLNIINDEGSNAADWRGGFNCRHIWKQITYHNDGNKIVNKGSVTKNRVDGMESLDVFGDPQNDTRTSNPSFSKEVFDDCPDATQDIATNLKNRQNAIDTANYGPLNPNEPNEEYWKKKADMFGGDVESAKKARCGNCVFFVKTPSMLECIAKGINDTNEWDTIESGDLGYCEAFDFKCAAARTCDAWVVGGPITEETMGYDNNLPPYVDQVSGKTIPKSIMFESYNDYPESASNNACKVLRWRDEHGDEVKGMTQVGWTRANQLCNKENISEETIARMASFARHRENAEVAEEFKSTPWKDKGYVAWLGWGGTTGIEWASSKLESIRNNMSKQHFAILEDEKSKKIVLGPAMIPNQKIFRKDALGNPYYVWFSESTIKLICEKYMRNKYTDNNDTMHDGKAVKDIHVLESWIVEDPEHDKAKKYGFDVPAGTWMISMKVNNPKVWEQILEKKLNGFSVSGYFEEVASFSREEMFLYKVAEILKNVKD